MGNNFDTNCFEYNLDYSYSNFNMRSDCIAWCYQQKTNKLCNSQAHILSGDLFRKEVWYQDEKKTLNHCFSNDTGRISSIHGDIISSCNKECQKDCKFAYYTLDVKNARSNANSDRTKIYLEHSSTPDITVNYLPEITWLSLVCNFGGLLGMWLGICFIGIIEDSKIIITNYIKRRKSKITINFLQLVELKSEPSTSSQNQQNNTVKSDFRLFYKRKINKIVSNS